MKKSKYWRGRLSKGMDMSAANYISSLEEDRRLIDFDIDVLEAHCLMLNKQEYISKDELAKILSGLEKARNELKKDASKILATDTFHDIHPIIEEYVIKSYGVNIGGLIGLGKSRNDQIVTDMRMYVRDEILKISDILIRFIDSMLKLAMKNKKTLFIGYTHFQPAQLTTFSHYLISYVDFFIRCIERLNNCYRMVNLSPLGSSALASSTLKLDREFTSKLLGFDGLVENTIDSVSNRDFILEFGFCLATIMSGLSRIAEDLIVQSSAEFDYIKLPDEFLDTSTFMPQKKNPCPLEILRAKSAVVSSLLSSMFNILNSLPTGYYRDLQEMKPALWKMIDIVKSSVEIIEKVLIGLNINKERILDSLRKNDVLASELSEYLATEKGINFREANFLVGKILSKLKEQNKSIADLPPQLLRNIARKVIKKDIKIDQHELSNLFNPFESLKRRANIGGPAVNVVDKAIDLRSSYLDKLKREIKLLSTKVQKSRQQLKKLVEQVIGG